MSQWQPSSRQPMFNAPGVVVALIGLMVGIHSALGFLPTTTFEELLIALAVIPARYGTLAPRIPGPEWSALWSPVTHMLLHGDWPHLLINSGWLLAFGSAIARRIGAMRMLAMFALSGLAAAALYILVHHDEISTLVGASGGISGLMGGAFRFMFAVPEPTSVLRMSRSSGGEPWQPRLVPLAGVLHNRQLMLVVGGWLGVNLVFGLIPPGFLFDGSIAWEAHVGGFLLGFLGMGLFEPRGAGGQH